MKERLNWIDALRGFTMFSVVVVHVLTSTLGVRADTSLVATLRGAFTLPLFFIVSGFFLYRPEISWDWQRVLRSTRVRFVAMILGASIFYTAYYLHFHSDKALSWLECGDYGRYWFTPALFQMYCYYLILVGISRLCRKSLIIPFFILTVSANIAMQFIPALNDVYWCSWAMSKKTFIYTQFFALGLMARKYEDKFMKIVMNPYVFSLSLVCLIGGTALHLIITAGKGVTIPEWIGRNAYDFLAKYGGALLVLNIFYYNREYFNGNGRFVRYWRKVGTRTLDIYYFHYFMIPQLYWIYPYINRGNPFLVELGLSMMFATAIVILCIGLSNLVRRAPILRNLVGAKGPLPPQLEPAK